MEESNPNLSKKEINNLESYRAYCIKAARELHYGEKVIEQIEEATNENRISSIMLQARLDSFG